jgi:hypothetical protein
MDDDGLSHIFSWIDTNKRLYQEWRSAGGSTSTLTSDTTIDFDRWYHVIYNYNATSQIMTLYIDGEHEKNASQAPKNLQFDNLYAGTMFSSGAISSNLYGELDEFVIQKHALNLDQIYEIYHTPSISSPIAGDHDLVSETLDIGEQFEYDYNWSDAWDENLTYTVNDTNATINDTGYFSFNETETGVYSFTVNVTDGFGNWKQDSFILTYLTPNTPPTLSSGEFNQSGYKEWQDMTYSIDVDDSDSPGINVTYQWYVVSVLVKTESFTGLSPTTTVNGSLSSSFYNMSHNVSLTVSAWDGENRSDNWTDNTIILDTFACENGLDDDGDSLTDWPDDPGCDSLSDDSELNPSFHNETIFTERRNNMSLFSTDVLFLEMGDAPDNGTHWFDVSDSGNSTETFLPQMGLGTPVIQAYEYTNVSYFNATNTDILIAAVSDTEDLHICQYDRRCVISFRANLTSSSAGGLPFIYGDTTTYGNGIWIQYTPNIYGDDFGVYILGNGTEGSPGMYCIMGNDFQDQMVTYTFEINAENSTIVQYVDGVHQQTVNTTKTGPAADCNPESGKWAIKDVIDNMQVSLPHAIGIGSDFVRPAQIDAYFDWVMVLENVDEITFNTSEYMCNDGVDNDGNNLTDWPDDPGCTAFDDDDEWSPEPPSPEPPHVLTDDIAIVLDDHLDLWFMLIMVVLLFVLAFVLNMMIFGFLASLSGILFSLVMITRFVNNPEYQIIGGLVLIVSVIFLIYNGMQVTE